MRKKIKINCNVRWAKIFKNDEVNRRTSEQDKADNKEKDEFSIVIKMNTRS